MRLVLDVVSTLITQNPNARVREVLKAEFLSTLVSIISRRSMRPVVKSCISSLTMFLTKSVLTLEDLARQYGSVRPDLAGGPIVMLWREWVGEIFNWMELHYICPVAGKFLVVIFSNLFSQDSVADPGRTNSTGFDINVLRQWLEAAISDNLDNLENVKNYMLANMFKSDRGLSIALLKELNNRGPEQRTNGAGEEVTALLHLAALEIGKKSSIVDEPSKYCILKPFRISILPEPRPRRCRTGCQCRHPRPKGPRALSGSHLARSPILRHVPFDRIFLHDKAVLTNGLPAFKTAFEVMSCRS